MGNKKVQQESILSLRSMLTSLNKVNDPILIAQTLKLDLRKMMMSQENQQHKWKETVHSCLPALQHIEVR